MLAEHGGATFATFKAALAELATEKLAPVNAEMRRLMADPGHIDAILADGARRAREIADPNMSIIKDIVGFIGE